MSTMDDFLKRKLYDHTSELPQDMWQKIEAGIKEDSNKKGFFLYFLSGFLLLFIAGGLTFYLWPSANPNPILNHPQKEINEEVIPIFQNDVIDEENELRVLNKPNKTKDQLSVVALKKKSSNAESVKINEIENILQLSITHSTNSYDSNSGATNKNIAKTISTERKVGPLAFLEHDLLSVNLPERAFPDPLGCPSFSKNRYSPNVFIEGYTGLIMAQQIISAKGAETNPDYVQLRRNSESPLISWMAGVNLGWISNYNVGLKGGLNYESINERFRFTDSTVVRNQTVITIDTMFNPDGSISSIASDTSIQQVFGYEDQSVYNYHKTLNIPIELLYQFDLGNLDLEVSGGAIFSLRYTNRGKILDPTSEARWFTNGENGTYRVFNDNFSVALTFSASALYNLNSHVQLFARPSIKYTLNTLSTASSPFDQKYLNYGVSAGARYYFSENPNY